MLLAWPTTVAALLAQAPRETRILDSIPGASPLPADPGTAPPSLSHLIQQHQWAEVAQLAEQSTVQHPHDSTMFYWLGVARENLHDPVRAVLALRSAQRLGLNTPGLYLALGSADYNLQQYILFVEHMQQAIRLDPSRYEAYYYLAIYYEDSLNRWDRALELFQRAGELKPNDPKSIYGAGYCLEALGKRDEAAKAYRRSIELLERNGDRFSGPSQGMARLLVDTDPDKALQFAQKAVEFEENSASNRMTLAKAYERLGKLTQAAQELQVATRLSPTEASVRFALARVYKKLGNSEAADSELQMFDKLTRIYGP